MKAYRGYGEIAEIARYLRQRATSPTAGKARANLNGGFTRISADRKGQIPQARAAVLYEPRIAVIEKQKPKAFTATDAKVATERGGFTAENAESAENQKSLLYFAGSSVISCALLWLTPGSENARVKVVPPYQAGQWSI